MIRFRPDLASLPASARDAFARVLDPLDPGRFFDEVFEDRHELIARDDPERFADLVSIAAIDDFVASHELHAGMIDMTRAEPQIMRNQFIQDNDVIDRSAVMRLYQDKGTLIAPHFHSYHKPLADFVRALEPVFSAQIQTNIYLTPPGAQGFRTHYDNHDVFVLQVSGSKKWRLYNTPVDKPFRGEGFEPGVHDVGEPEQEFLLHAGDTVYIPRGMMHDADSFDDHSSLHITLGLVAKTWADLVLESISKVALGMDSMRRALPPGYANPDFDRGPAREQFAAFIAEIADKAEFDDPLDIVAEDYLKGRAPALGGIIDHASRIAAPGQRYRAVGDALYRIVADDENEGNFVVTTRGGASEYKGAKRPAFDRAMSGEPFAAGDLPGMEDEESRDLITRLISRGLVVPA